MTQFLTTLALSLVIVASVAAPSVAKVDGIFEEVSGDFTHPTKHFDASEIFDNPSLRKLDDRFSVEKIAQNKVDFNYDDSFDISLDVPTLAKSSVESGIFNPIALEQYSQEAARAKAEREEATKRAEYDAYITEHNRQLNEENAAKLTALTAPSLGNYLYSASENVFNWAGYTVRSMPFALLVIASNIDYVDEAAASMVYYAVSGISIVTSGGNLAAGFIPGYSAYYFTKYSIKTARKVVPFFEAWLTWHYAGKLQTSINYTFDVAPAYAKETASTAGSLVSYFRSYWT